MSDPKSPFEDANFSHFPPGMEVRHQPGMAAALMDQLAPLLAADGIDLEHLEDVDLDELNAAMGRAIERHNMELHTPVGNERARTINTLREIAQALHQEQPTVVQQLFETVGPHPTKTRPSIGYVTGVGMETLDSLYSDKTLRSALGVVRLPILGNTTKNAAQEIQGLAAKSKAFSSIDKLMLNHGGFEIAKAAAYLLAATVAAIAEHGRAEFSAVLDELIPEEHLTEEFVQGSAFGVAAAHQTSANDYTRAFQDWLEEDEELAEDAPEILGILASITADAQRAGIDIHEPEQFDAWLFSLQDSLVPENTAVSLDTMHCYVHFRLTHDAEPHRWYQAHAAITEITEEATEQSWDLDEILFAAQQEDPELRHRQIKSLPIVAGMLKLAEWLGSGQPVTTTGVPKRADIQTVAAMIGLELEGVAKMPEGDATGYVQSALDSAELMAWWSALEDLEVIEVTSTKVKPGSMIQEYVTADPVPLDQAEAMAAMFVCHLLTQQLGQSPVDAPALGYTITRLVDSMAGEAWVWEVDDADLRARMIKAVSNGHLKYLQDVQLLELYDGEPAVPQTLHVPMVLGLMMAIDELGQFL